MVFLGIDVGTSTAKALALDEAGAVVAQARANYPTHRPQPGWAEQDPEDWWRAVIRVIHAVNKQLQTQGLKVENIGLTGQMHGPVILGRDGELLGPCMLWMDTRAETQASALTSSIGEKRLLTLTGNPAVAAFPAAKLLWLKRHRPEVHRAIRMVLISKDYIGFRLTGQYATDPSDASGTLLFDLHAGRWSEVLVETVGLPVAALPTVAPATARLGDLTEAAAQQTGLRAGTPVFVGAGDLATAAVGNGLVRPDQVAITLGTAGQLLFHLKRWSEALPGRFYLFASAIPGAYLGLGTIPTGGAALHWLARLLTGEVHPDVHHLEELVKEAEHVPPGARGLVFLPYLAGTGTPHLDYQARGAFIGLTEAHGPAELVRALMEGVAYALQDSLQLLQAEGLQPQEIRIAGGGMKNPLWTRIQADIYGCPLRPVHILDASPLGACLLAAVACGRYRNLAEACEAAVKVGPPIAPEAPTAEYYRTGYAVFQQLYDRLGEIFPALKRWEGQR